MVRIATFNASLNRSTAGELIDDLSTATDTQAQAVAEIIQRVNPDILLINEFDYDATGYAAELFQENYLGISQNGVDPVEYSYVYFAPSNTGIASGFDLDNNGNIASIPGQSGYGNDAFGFGNFPGQYGMVLYSKLPIQFQDVRTFQFFKWQDMPDALLPVDPTTGEAWYSQAELEAFRLSSKSHWDIPIEVDGEIIHLLASHPTPPVFDGLEDRNGTRNHDEIRFWADYISPGENDYIYDDGGTFQGFAGGERFVILGDQNADPVDGDSVDGAILQLLNNPLINTSLTPSSDGGADASERQEQANDNHQGAPIYDTADFGDAPPSSGNLRVDYVLPSTNLDLVDAGIFWPTSDDPLFSLVGEGGSVTSDHRLTWIDVDLTIPIYEIQGDGSISPILEQTVITEGIVVGDFQRSDQLQGFYIQSPDSATDANPNTSEGLFIFDPNLTVDVQVGDRVQIAGTVKEFTSTDSSLTQLANITEITILDQNNPLPIITPVTLPEADLEDWEALEGMLVTVTDTDEPLTVSETFNLGRFGEVRLSADGRVIQYTNFNEPNVAGNAAYQEEVLQRTVILDDGSTRQNLYFEPLTRAGNTLESITGIVDDRFSIEYRIQPTEIPDYINSNPRTDSPTSVGGSLRVASFNVLNYFNGDGMGGGFPTSRGASSPEEFTRQRDKTISAILAMDADIVGLIEMENDGYDEKSAIEDLVNGLNTKAGTQSYAFIDPGVDQLGTDEITVGFIYQVADVTPVGDAAILDKSVDPDFNTDIQRPALAQTFQEKATGEIFTPVINHFKSKGGGSEATGDDLDQGDGQGAFNATRTKAAEALTEWLATDPTQSGDPDVLILGDLNAYLQEDPITTIEEAGYTNLIEQFVGDEAYSFVFFGQSGTLDHALSSPSLTAQVTGVTEWHINADEPNFLDYNLEFKSDAQKALYEADPFRSSDHDPVIVGLQLKDSNPPLTVYGTPDDDSFDSVFPDEKGFIGNQQILFTGSGNDTVDVTFALGGNRVDLGSGDDLLFAGANNRIIAGSGDDLLYVGSGNGNNVITGGVGKDQFWLVTDVQDLPIQSNVITDFTAGSDAIGFANTNLNFAALTLLQNGQNTFIQAFGQNIAQLLNVQANSLTEADFIFA
jgi:predicted extracellular nuclease